MTDKEKLVELLQYGMDKYFLLKFEAEVFADLLIANGVTFAKDTDVPGKWISVEERLPEDGLPANSTKKQIKVLTAIKGENGYTVRSQMRMRNYYISKPETWAWKYSGGKITHWMPLPQPPREE